MTMSIETRTANRGLQRFLASAMTAFLFLGSQAQAQLSDADLDDLTVEIGGVDVTLTPAFSSSIRHYTILTEGTAAEVEAEASVPSGSSDTHTIVLTDPVGTEVMSSSSTGGDTVTATSASYTLDFGDNMFTARVTVSDGTDTNEIIYTVNVRRADSRLGSITLSEGTLDPVFVTDTTEYDVRVAGAIDVITVTAMPENESARVSVVHGPAGGSSATVQCRQDAAPVACITVIALGYGDTEITITVTDDTATTNYEIEVTRTDLTLADLEIDEGMLTPEFNSSFLNYTASVAGAVDSLNLNVEFADTDDGETKTAVVSSDTDSDVSDTALTSGTDQGIDLSFGPNVITVVVTVMTDVDGDGTNEAETLTYTLTVTRIVVITGLSVVDSDGTALTITPATFVATTLAYNLENTESADLDITASFDDGVTVTVAGTEATTAVAVEDVALEPGANTIEVVATVTDGTLSTTYRLLVYRGLSTLSELTPATGTLRDNTVSREETTFDSATTGYAINLPATVGLDAIASDNGIFFTATASAPDLVSISAQVSSGGDTTDAVDVTSGMPFLAELAGTMSTLTITITDNEDTSFTTSYTVNIDFTELLVTNLAFASSDTADGELDYPTVPAATDSGGRDDNVAIEDASYSVVVPDAEIQFRYRVPTRFISYSTETETLTLNGQEVTASSTTTRVADLTLEFGINVLTLTLGVDSTHGVNEEGAAADETRVITITINRPNTLLDSVSLSVGEISSFDPEDSLIAGTVPSNISETMLTAVPADAGATMTFDGVAVMPDVAVRYTLDTGNNAVVIVVTLDDFTRTYNLSIQREDVRLTGLAVRANLPDDNNVNVPLDPVFSPDRLAYALTVTSDVTTLAVVPAFTSGTSVSVVSGSSDDEVEATATSSFPVSVALTDGTQTITVVTVNDDNPDDTLTYTLTVTRPAVSIALSNIALSVGSLSPDFDANTLSYTAQVSNVIAQVTVTTAGSVGTLVTIRNATADSPASSSGVVLLDRGANNIDINVSYAGFSRDYRVVITRTDLGLRSFGFGDGVPFDPAYSDDHATYTALLSGTGELTADVALLARSSTATLMLGDDEVSSPETLTLPADDDEAVFTLTVSEAGGIDDSDGSTVEETRSYTIILRRVDSLPVLTGLTMEALSADGTATAVTVTSQFDEYASSASVPLATTANLRITPTVGAEETLRVNGETPDSDGNVTVPFNLPTTDATQMIVIEVTLEGFTARHTLSVLGVGAADATASIVGVFGVSGTYSEGDEVHIFLRFDRPVLIASTTTSPFSDTFLTLETGDNDRVALYETGLGTNTLTYIYTVRNGDYSSDLNYLEDGVLQLRSTASANLGSVFLRKDQALPDADGDNSLAANSNIVIDARDAMPVRVSGRSGTYVVGEQVMIHVDFNKPVRPGGVVGEMGLMLETGTIDRMAAYAGVADTDSTRLSFAYTVQAGDQSMDLNYASTDLILRGARLAESHSVRAAIISLPASDSAQSLAGTSNIRISLFDLRTQNTRLTEIMLPKISQAIATATVDALQQRFSGDNSGSNKQSFDRSLASLFARGAASRDFDLKQMVGNGNFNVPLQSNLDGDGFSSPMLWVRGHVNNMSHSDEQLDYEGDIYGVSIGVDGHVGDGTLVGVSINWSDADFEYEDGLDARDRKGSYNYEVITFNPYANWTLSDRMNLWGMLGLGRGVIDSTTPDAESETDTDHLQAALGFRYNLTGTQSFRLRIKGDVTLSKVDVEASPEFESREVDTERVRIAIEADNTYDVRGGHILKPRGSAGLRYDGGDGETGVGIELAGALVYRDPDSKIYLEAKGRYQYGVTEEWGASLMTNVDLQVASTGLTFSVGPVIGVAHSQISSLWEKLPAGDQQVASHFKPEMRLVTEVSYGLRLPVNKHAILSPYTRMDFGDELSRFETGGRLTIGKRFDLAMKLSQGYAGAYNSPLEFGLEGSLRF